MNETITNKKKRVWTIVIAVILILAVAVTLVAGSLLCRFAFKADDQTFEDFVSKNGQTQVVGSVPAEVERFYKSTFFDTADVDPAGIEATQDGAELYAREIVNPQTNAWVIAVHGYGCDGSSMAGYAEKFYGMGYNVLVPDLRGNGKSGGDYFGMGWLDRLDIIDWIDYINEKYSSPEIVLFGVSMGGATVMMTTGETLPGNVVAAIEDCGYSSVYAELKYGMKAFVHMPSFPILNAVSLFTKIRAGYDFLNEGDCVSAVRRSVTPTLFIHGEADKFVPFSMLSEVYDAAGCEREKLTVAGAEHSQSAAVAPEKYWGTVSEFLNKYVSQKTGNAA